MLGGFLSLCSAACFALNNASTRRGVITGSIIQGMAVTVPLGIPLFFAAAVLTGNLGAVTTFSPATLASLAAAGAVHFVWGRYCNYRAIQAIGTNLVGPLQQVNLLVTLALAIWLLGEHLTPLRILGIVLVLFGPMLAMGGKPKAAAATAPADSAPMFQPRYAEGYTFTLLSAVGYGLSPIFMRYGLEHQSVGASLAGGLVAYCAATAVFAPILLWPGNWRHTVSVDRETLKWFTFSGVLVFVSQMLLFMAMTLAPVTVVMPINRLTILFRLYFSRLLNPQHEVFGGPVVLATVVSLAGALALSASTEFVQSLLPLPAQMLGWLNWQWP